MKRNTCVIEMSTRIVESRSLSQKLSLPFTLPGIPATSLATSSPTVDRNDGIEKVEFPLRIILSLQRPQSLKPRILVAVDLLHRLVPIGVVDVRVQSSTGSISRKDDGAETSAVLRSDGVVGGRRCVLGQERAVRTVYLSESIRGVVMEKFVGMRALTTECCPRDEHTPCLHL